MFHVKMVKSCTGDLDSNVYPFMNKVLDSVEMKTEKKFLT